MIQIQYITGTLTSGAVSANPSSPGIRLRATFATTGDRFLRNSWLSGVLFTTSSVDPLSTDALRGLHHGVCTCGAPATPTDELAVVNTMDVSVSIRSLDLLVIQSSFEDRFVIWLLNL
jgi:hypothetical protein